MGSGSDDYEVGYRRPPIATRWKPGQCGNPKGRPRKVRSVADDLRDALSQTVKILERGRPRTMTVQSLILRNIAHDAANKNLAAARLLFSLLANVEQAGATELPVASLDADDSEILQSYVSGARGAGQELSDKG